MNYQKEFDELILEYPKEFRSILINNRSRILWQVRVVVDSIKKGGRLIDIGAGVVPFMLICQRLGYETIVLDDFGDDGYKSEALQTVLDMHTNEGVIVKNVDIFNMDLNAFENGEYDLVFTSDSMEHWHHSPKKLFRSLWTGMKDDALFWLGVPNCVNLRKRLTVPFGRGKWSKMQDWYEPDLFRGHVREPDTDDLFYIGRDLGARRMKIVGRNWIGYRHPSTVVRKVTPLVDRILQKFPCVCADIYLFAWK